MSGGGERTYEPTAQRREQFRKEGRVAQARDVGPLAATVAAGFALHAGRARLLDATTSLFAHTAGDLGAAERLGAGAAVRGALAPIALELGSILAAASLAALLAAAAQTRFRLRGEAVAPKLDRLDPSQGFARLFAVKKNAIQLVLSLARAGAAGGAAYWALAGQWRTLLAASHAPLVAATETAGGVMVRVLAFTVVALAVLAGIDYAQSWFMLERDLKMTRQERMDEARREDGDPKLKARMKARARANAKRRALQSVKNADVIVTNPTHISVALRYGPRDPAPIVIAKGHDEAALKIRAEARRHGVPILENRPLARALDAEVQIGRPVPPARFAAVAQVLAFVYRLKKRGALGGDARRA